MVLLLNRTVVGAVLAISNGFIIQGAPITSSTNTAITFAIAFSKYIWGIGFSQTEGASAQYGRPAFNTKDTSVWLTGFTLDYISERIIRRGAFYIAIGV